MVWSSLHLKKQSKCLQKLTILMTWNPPSLKGSQNGPNCLDYFNYFEEKNKKATEQNLDYNVNLGAKIQICIVKINVMLHK